MNNHELDAAKGIMMYALLGACFWILVVGVVAYLW